MLEHGKPLLRSRLTFGERVPWVHLFEDLDKWLDVERIESPVRCQCCLLVANKEGIVNEPDIGFYARHSE